MPPKACGVHQRDTAEGLTPTNRATARHPPKRSTIDIAGYALCIGFLIIFLKETAGYKFHTITIPFNPLLPTSMIITVVDSMLRLPQYGPLSNDANPMGNPLTINKTWFREQLSRIGMSQRQLAKRIHLDPAAISYMFAGKRGMSMDEAKAIAGELLLPVTEVMRQAGIEVLDDVRKVPIAGYIGAGSTVTLLPKGTHDTAMAPPDVPSGSFAIQVRMVQTTFDGWLYFVSGVQEPPENTTDCLCLVAVEDGRLLQGIVRRGYKRELFNLVLSPDGGTVLENQKIAWAARVLWIQPL